MEGEQLFRAEPLAPSEAEAARVEREEEVMALQAIFGDDAVTQAFEADLFRLRVSVAVTVPPMVLEGACSPGACVFFACIYARLRVC